MTVRSPTLGLVQGSNLLSNLGSENCYSATCPPLPSLKINSFLVAEVEQDYVYLYEYEGDIDRARDQQTFPTT